MFVILFNGPPGSGKDTAAGIMVRHFTKNGIKAQEFKFAYMLKKGVHESLALSVPVNAFEGKTKDEPSNLFFGLTPRQAYIKHSEYYMKKVYGNSVFALLLLRQLEAAKRKGITIACVSDCGFSIEVDTVVDKYTIAQSVLFRLRRHGCDFSKDSRDYLQHSKMANYDIDNNRTLHELSMNLEGYYTQFMRMRNAKQLEF